MDHILFLVALAAIYRGRDWRDSSAGDHRVHGGPLDHPRARGDGGGPPAHAADRVPDSGHDRGHGTREPDRARPRTRAAGRALPSGLRRRLRPGAWRRICQLPPEPVHRTRSLSRSSASTSASRSGRSSCWRWPRWRWRHSTGLLGSMRPPARDAVRVPHSGVDRVTGGGGRRHPDGCCPETVVRCPRAGGVARERRSRRFSSLGCAASDAHGRGRDHAVRRRARGRHQSCGYSPTTSAPSCPCFPERRRPIPRCPDM